MGGSGDGRDAAAYLRSDNPLKLPQQIGMLLNDLPFKFKRLNVRLPIPSIVVLVRAERLLKNQSVLVGQHGRAREQIIRQKHLYAFPAVAHLTPTAVTRLIEAVQLDHVRTQALNVSVQDTVFSELHQRHRDAEIDHVSSAL